jgi:excinuclease ABC subunit C
MILENINIPQTPGCYIFKDIKDKIIYVGKSKFLPKRVKSYFHKNHDDLKTKKLVEKINSVDFVICESESESLVVEENLIKLYQPEYNIKGKDDKTTRQVLIIEKENYPRINLARNTECAGHEILALFTSGRMAHEVYDLIHQVFPFRSCSYNLSEENITEKKFKPCLELQINNCLGPCLGEVKKIQYLYNINQIKKIFNFDYDSVRKDFKKRMRYFSKNLDFEKANDILNRSKNLETLIKKIEPLRLNKIKEELIQIGKDLEFKQAPLVIEAFDNSHTGGTQTVSASVRYIMGHPEKSSYRKYIIRSGSGADDYGSFREVLLRRFKRLIDEKIQLPNLVIIDGARPQLNVAIEVFKELKIMDKLDLISISKDKNHRPYIIHTTKGKDVDIMSLKSRHLLATILEEVHRFVITFHRLRRDKIK